MGIRPTDPYLYPNTTAVEPLEYSWDGYREVHVFTTSDDFANVVDWYQTLSPDDEQYELDRGLLEIYFYDDDDDQIGSVLAVDTRSEYSTAYLRSYVGSRVVNGALEAEGAKVVGVRFIDEQPQSKSKE